MKRVTCRDEHGRPMMNDGPTTRGDACTILLERCAAYEGTELEPEEVKAEIERLKQWVNDLQSGMYVNCVYCGHRYGPADKVPVSMAEALKQHIEQCPKHPMSKLKAELAQAKADRLLETTCEGCNGRKSVQHGKQYQCMYCRRNYGDKHDLAHKVRLNSAVLIGHAEEE